jgi:hypothetical protein
MADSLSDLFAQYLASIRDRKENEVEEINKILRTIYQDAVPQEKTSERDHEQIKWIQCEGPRGPYERAEQQDTPQFQLLLNDLEQAGGKLHRDGYFCWKFNTEQPIVGRKKQKQT